MTLVSIILPTRERPEQAQRCVDRFRATTRGYDVELVVVTDDPATGTQGCDLIRTPPMSALDAWNYGATQASGDILVLAADDLWPFHGWLGETLERMADFPDARGGMIGFNDLARDGRALATHWAITRAAAVAWNGGVLVPPCYHHYFCDNEVTARLKRAGRYIWAANAVVEHRHPAWNKAEADALYLSKVPLMDADRAIFEQRQEAGFPDDFAAVLHN
jgi:glycosyltransferase involved in cell wall biosynthesis